MIAPNVASAVSATMTGAIYALPGGPPGFLETGEGTVIGEIVELTDLAAAFALLDAYQGDDFIRLLKLAKLEDGTETYAWTYVLADERIADEGEPILSGDWIKYIKGPYE